MLFPISTMASRVVCDFCVLIENFLIVLMKRREQNSIAHGEQNGLERELIYLAKLFFLSLICKIWLILCVHRIWLNHSSKSSPCNCKWLQRKLFHCTMIRIVFWWIFTSDATKWIVFHNVRVSSALKTSTGGRAGRALISKWFCLMIRQFFHLSLE